MTDAQETSPTANLRIYVYQGQVRGSGTKLITKSVTGVHPVDHKAFQLQFTIEFYFLPKHILGYENFSHALELPLLSLFLKKQLEMCLVG